jgi:hypothetical protein
MVDVTLSKKNTQSVGRYQTHVCRKNNVTVYAGKTTPSNCGWEMRGNEIGCKLRSKNPSVDAITIDSYSQSLRSQLDGASEVASSDFDD